MDELRTQIAANEEHRKHEHEEQVQQGIAARAKIAREMALIEVSCSVTVQSCAGVSILTAVHDRVDLSRCLRAKMTSGNFHCHCALEQ